MTVTGGWGEVIKVFRKQRCQGVRNVSILENFE